MEGRQGSNSGVLCLAWRGECQATAYNGGRDVMSTKGQREGRETEGSGEKRKEGVVRKGRREWRKDIDGGKGGKKLS